MSKKKLLGWTLVAVPVLAYFGSAVVFSGWITLLQLLGIWLLVVGAAGSIITGMKLLGK